MMESINLRTRVDLDEFLDRQFTLLNGLRQMAREQHDMIKSSNWRPLHDSLSRTEKSMETLSRQRDTMSRDIGSVLAHLEEEDRILTPNLDRKLTQLLELTRQLLEQERDNSLQLREAWARAMASLDAEESASKDEGGEELESADGDGWLTTALRNTGEHHH